MKCLGIDPGIEITGFGILEANGSSQQLIEYGVIRTSKDDSTPDRLLQLHTDLMQVLQKHPDIAVAGVEELFFAKNAKSAFQVGQARGVILLTLEMHHILIREVKPVEVKAAIVGSGNADKKEVQKMVQLTFNLDTPPQPDDAADAIAIALCMAFDQELKQQL